MVAPVIIGPGIEIGAGISMGPQAVVASFTVNPADITFSQLIYSGYSSYDSNGFTSDGTQIYNGISYTISPGLHSAITTAMTSAGLDPANAYAWNVAFTTGGTILARVGLDASGSNSLGIAPIDQSDTRWQTGDLNGPTLTGTFTFPATFTPYIPVTQLLGATNWC